MQNQTEDVEKEFIAEVKLTVMIKVKIKTNSQGKAEQSYMENIENIDAEQLRLQLLNLGKEVTYEVQDAYTELECDTVAEEEMV